MMLESGLDKIDVEVQTSLRSLDDFARSKVEEELSKLREDKSLLEGKIRGYLTLSEICQEYKEELNRLKTEYEKLLMKVKPEEMTSESRRHLSSVSPTPEDNLGTANGHDLEQRNTHIRENTDMETTNLNKTHREDFNQSQKDKPIRTSELFDPGPEQAKSSEGSKSIPEASSEKSMEATKHDHIFGIKGDKYPMQESMGMSSHGQLNPSSLTGLGFEHVSDHMPLGESAGNMRSNSNPDDLMVFASLTRAENDKTAKKKKQEVSEINEVITSLPLQSNDTSKVVQTVTKFLERKDQQIKKLTHMNSVLIEKNSQLQREKKEMEKDSQRILVKVQRLEKEAYDMSRSRSKSPQEGWVKVDKVTENELQKSSVENISAPRNSVPDLEEQNKQLRDANQKWSQEWDKLRKHFESRIKDLQMERDRLAKENTDMKIKEDAKERDYEKMIMNAKKKAADEESAKEDALLQLTTANSRLDSLNAQHAELHDEISRMRREKQSIETEVNVLRQQTTSAGGRRTVDMPVNSQSEKTITDLTNENYVLRQQILVFQEDFDRERQDRATAQSLKEDLKKQNESLKKRARQLEMKCSNLDRQVKSGEDMSRRTLMDKDKLQQELSELKVQLQRERENRAISQYQAPQPVIQSAGMYQPVPHHQTPQGLYTQGGWPHPSPPPITSPPNTQYQQRVNGGMYLPASQPQAQSPIYAVNQPGQETEMLVGAWACSQCTYKNYPGRTVCEMCGYIQSPTTNQQQMRVSSGLTPRGEGQPQRQQQAPQGYLGYNVAGTQRPLGMTGT